MWQKKRNNCITSNLLPNTRLPRISCETASRVVVKIETNGHESNKLRLPCVMLDRPQRLSQEFVIIA